MPDKAAARSNLGLGTAATQSVGTANGLATLDFNTLVPMTQLKTGVASALATLDAQGHVPFTQLNAGAPSGIATLTAGGLITPTQLPSGTSPTSLAKSADYTTQAPDSSKVISVTTGSSTDVNITMLSAGTAGDGATMTIQKVDSGTKRVIVKDSDGTTHRAWLSGQEDIVSFRSNGSTWKVYWTDIAPRIDIYSTSGANTWTKPPLAVQVRVDIIGAGGGGGSGGIQVLSPTQANYGGGSGGGGAFYSDWFSAGDLASTETVTIGAGGTGGAGVSGSGASGSVGNAGSASTFGSVVKMRVAGGGAGLSGSLGSTAGAGIGGGVWDIAPQQPGNQSLSAVGFDGANQVAAIEGTAGNNAFYGGASAGVPNAGGTGGAGGSSVYGGGAGGAGGCVTTAGAYRAPGAGGGHNVYTAGGGAAAGTSAASPTAGADSTSVGVGGGGGGAGSSTSGRGGDGGPGGGGGGGGCCHSNTGTSARGGNGGNGRCSVVTMFTARA